MYFYSQITSLYYINLLHRTCSYPATIFIRCSIRIISGYLSTIVALDSSSYVMNNCELLYTGITRAKKYCVLVGNNYAIRKAIQTKETNTKQTFLKDMLIEKYKKSNDK